MKNVLRCMSMLVLCSTSFAWGRGVVRIADGDCTGLSAAAASQPGQEPSLIILARDGHYGSCVLDVSGRIVVDGAGANLSIALGASAQVIVAQGASLTLGNLNISGPTANTQITSDVSHPNFVGPAAPTFFISGTLILDSVSIFDNTTALLPQPDGLEGGGLFEGGDLALRNVTIASNVNETGVALFAATTSVAISNSSIVNNSGTVFGDSAVSIGNSILVGNGHSCSAGANVTSLGGNVTDDTTCGLVGAGDRLVADAHLLELGTHGGVVQNVALRNDSPAIGNAIVGNCEATDARGYSRGQTACDSGAYEFGGGNGNISATGMSGLYFNATNDGHYVSIQRLHDNTALVIWNTFDENGVPAWLYGVGGVSGNSIHVAQVARNTGGKLLPGGDVVGSQASVWGSIDVKLSDCYNVQLSYNSADPNFGSGSTSLARLAFLDEVNCAP